MLRIIYLEEGKKKRKHPDEMFDIVSNYSIAEESGVNSQKNRKNSNWSGCQEFTKDNVLNMSR